AALDTSRPDEIGEMARAVDVFRENSATRTQLEEKERAGRADHAQRQARIEQLIVAFRDSVGAVLSAVAASMNRLESTATSLSGSAGQAMSQAAVASDASGEAARQVKEVAAAAEELGSSVDEINRQVAQANSIVVRAT